MSHYRVKNYATEILALILVQSLADKVVCGLSVSADMSASDRKIIVCVYGVSAIRNNSESLLVMPVSVTCPR